MGSNRGSKDGTLERERRFRYDTAGRLIERLTRDPIGCCDREFFRYDAGRLVEHVLFDQDGTQVKHRETYEFDSSGRLERTRCTESHDASRGLRETVQHELNPGRAASSQQSLNMLIRLAFVPRFT